MVLDSRLAAVKEHFGISSMEDWRRVAPAEVLAIDDVGPVTLDHIRLYLCGRGVTLLGDMTPEYWKKNLDKTAICHQMTDAETCDVAPFRIVVDSNEKAPYGFQGMRNSNGRELIVPTITRRLSEDEGDYKVDGIDDVTIEKKEDVHELYSTLGARDEFEKQVKHMNAWLRVSWIVIGSSWDEIRQPGKYATPLHWQQDGDTGFLVGDDYQIEYDHLGTWIAMHNGEQVMQSRSLTEAIQFCERRHTSDAWRSNLHPRSVWETISSWSEKYPRVHWRAAGSRRTAEIMAFSLLEKTWRHSNE